MIHLQSSKAAFYLLIFITLSFKSYETNAFSDYGNGNRIRSKFPNNKSTLSRPLQFLDYNSRKRLLQSSAVADVTQDQEQGGNASMTSSVFNVVKACIGAGVLAFPSGVAAFADVKQGLVPSAVILVVLGAISAYSFYSIGRLSKQEDAASIGETWESTVSPSSSWVVDLSCFVTPIGAALSFSIILGDILSSVLKTLGLKGILASRHVSILCLTLSALYPLCSLASLSALAPMSIIGVLSSMMTCIFLGYRCLGGAYSPGGALLKSVPEVYAPSFGVKGMQLLSPSILILCAMAGTGYMVGL